MAGYISSNANRFYTALESGFGQLQAVQAENRIPAVKLAIEQQLETGAGKTRRAAAPWRYASGRVAPD